MKKFVVVCLLGIMGSLLPINETVAKESFGKKIINCHLEDDILLASSGESDGPISKIVITNSQKQIVLIESCGNQYRCEAYVGDLPSGNYVATVITTRSSYTTGFIL